MSQPREPRIFTKCPACGTDCLCINEGHLLCTWHKCPNPGLIDRAFKMQEELQAWREGGLTEEILRRNDGCIKVGKGCVIVVAEMADDSKLLSWIQEHLADVDAPNDGPSWIIYTPSKQLGGGAGCGRTLREALKRAVETLEA